MIEERNLLKEANGQDGAREGGDAEPRGRQHGGALTHHLPQFARTVYLKEHVNYLTVNPLARRGVMLDWNCIFALHIWVRLRLKFVPMHEARAHNQNTCIHFVPELQKLSVKN